MVGKPLPWFNYRSAFRPPEVRIRRVENTTTFSACSARLTPILANEYVVIRTPSMVYDNDLFFRRHPPLACSMNLRITWVPEPRVLRQFSCRAAILMAWRDAHFSR